MANGVAKRRWNGWLSWPESCEAGSEQARIASGEEDRSTEAEVGDSVAVRVGDAFDEAVEAEAA